MLDELVVGSQNLEIHALDLGDLAAGALAGKDLGEKGFQVTFERIQSCMGFILEAGNFNHGGGLSFALGLFGVGVDGSIDRFSI